MAEIESLDLRMIAMNWLRNQVHGLFSDVLTAINGDDAMSSLSEMPHKTIDASGLHCPQPILRCMASMVSMRHGDILHLITTDPDAVREIGIFIAKTDHVLLKCVRINQHQHFYIEKKIVCKPAKALPSILDVDLFSNRLMPCW